MANRIELYDEFADYYDLMVNWESRLKSESAFLREVSEKIGARRVLDLACGTGMHSILFTQWGLAVAAADPSDNMLRIARENARKAAAKIDFIQAGFGEVAKRTGQSFDIVFCLGNSLPHLLSKRALAEAIKDIFAVLRPGGIFVTQNRNYDKVWAEKNRFMPIDAIERQGKEALFFRFLDFHSRSITFNIATFVKDDGRWSYSVRSTKHRPLFRDDLERILLSAGFGSLEFLGDLKGNDFNRFDSGDMVIVAAKPS